MNDQYAPLRLFRNTEKMINLSHENWELAEKNDLINFFASTTLDGKLSRADLGLDFINMSSYSYLGLNRHPEVIRGGIEALEKERIISIHTLSEN